MDKPFVFNAFKNLLFKTGSKENKDLYNSIYFDAWICPKGKNFKYNNELDAQLSAYFESTGTGINKSIGYIGNLGILQRENVFSEDGLPSEDCYQSDNFLNIPASAYIFSTRQFPSNCNIDRDYNYTAFNYYVDDTSLDKYWEPSHSMEPGVSYDPVMGPKENYDLTKVYSVYDAQNGFHDKTMNAWEPVSGYFKSEYNFTSGYDPIEYATYNIKEMPLVENQMNVKSSVRQFDIPPVNMVGGALFITWYDGKRLTLYNNNGNLVTDEIDPITKQRNPLMYKSFPEQSGSCIPVCYMDLPQTYNLNKVLLNIEWSENGLFSLK